MKKIKLLKLHWSKILSILFLVLLLGAYSNTFAVAPSQTQDSNITSSSLLASVGSSIASGWNSFTGMIRDGVRTFLRIRDYEPGTSTTSPAGSVPSALSPTATTTIIQQITKAGLTGKAGTQGLRGFTGLQGPKGETGATPIIDLSSFVTKSFFDNQVDRIYDSTSNSIQGLSTSLTKEINTKLLTVTGDATIGGNLIVTGNITGNVVGVINPSFTLGSIPFQGTSGLVDSNSNFFWDNINSRLGIGTINPTEKLNVIGNILSSGTILGSNLSGTNTGDNAINSLYSGLATSKQDALNGTGFVKISGTTISYDNSTYLTSLSGAVLTNQSTPQTIGLTGQRLSKIWTTDLDVINTITGSISGNAGTVTNGVYTTGSYANPSWLTAIPYSILSGTVPTWNQNTTGNAATATNVAYSGLTGTVPTWNQDTTGNANTVTNGVYTSRTINGHPLSSDVTVTASDVGLGNVTNESKATMFTSPTFTGTVSSFTMGGNLVLGSNTLTTSNTDLVSNLNADLLDGQHGNYYAPATGGSYLPLSGGTMTGGITNSTSVNPLTTLAESWIGPSSTTGIYFKGGNVGIGTTDPQALLQISSRFKFGSDGVLNWGQAADGGALSWDTGKALIISSSGKDLSLGSNGVGDKLYIKTDGNVGIGTTTPTSKLSIIGSNKFASPHNVYLMGDSLTGTSDHYGTQFATDLGGSWSVVYAGTSGNSTTQMLARFTADVITPGNAEYVVIWGGVNDIAGAVTAATIESNLQTMYNLAHNAGLKVIAVNITPFSGDAGWPSSGATARATQDAVNYWIANNAKNVDYRVDAYSALVDPSVPYTLLPAYDDGGHLHLTSAGYIVAANAIYNATTFTPLTVPTMDINGTPSFSGALQVTGTISASNLSGNNTGDQYLGGLVPYSGATGDINLGVHNLTADTNSLFVDSINHRVGIGTTTPASLLQVGGGIKLNSDYTISWGSGGASQGILTWDTNKAIIGAQTDNALIFALSSYEKMRIDTNGNVGIGTTGPAAKLSVERATASSGTISGSDFQELYLNDDTEVAGEGPTLTFASDYNSGANKTIRAAIRGGTEIIGANAAGFLAFYTNTDVPANNTLERMRITSTGNVGIGTTNPSYILSLGGTATRTFGMNRNTTAGIAGQGLTITSGGAIAGTADLVGGDLTLSGGISTGTGTSAIHFLTATAGASAVTDRTPTEKMTILGNGNIGIGIIAPTNLFHVTGTPATGIPTVRIANTLEGTTQNNGLLILAGNDTGVNASQMITFQRPDATVIGSISQNAASTIAFNTSSDKRIKEDITPTTFGLSDLLKINVSDFTFISDPSKQKITGFIAQELYDIYPSAVTTNGDNGIEELAQGVTPWMIDYSKLTPLIVKSVQDLDLKLEEINNIDKENTWRDSIIAWFGNITNGITDIFAGTFHAKDKLCINNTCVTEAQLQTLLQNSGINNTSESTTKTDNTNDTGNNGGSIGDGAGTNENGSSTDSGNTNSSGNSEDKSIVDNTAPVIVLLGESSITIKIGDTYNEAGATATDDIDASVVVDISGTVDTTTVGTYTITYKATDTAGNKATEITRTVNVEEPKTINQ